MTFVLDLARSCALCTATRLGVSDNLDRLLRLACSTATRDGLARPRVTMRRAAAATIPAPAPAVVARAENQDRARITAATTLTATLDPVARALALSEAADTATLAAEARALD